MLEIVKITDDNYEVVICGKLKTIINREEAFDILLNLSELLNYEIRDKW